MNRPIKFRAWDKEKKEWCEDFRITRQGFVVHYHQGDSDLIGDIAWIIHEDDSRFVLMQFTGLHDKEGKEIYEGDVLDYDSKDYKVVDGRGAVSFLDGCFVAKWPSGYLLILELQNTRVIGNIYENPELL